MAAAVAFGSPAPYAEPLWYSRDSSPYYKESHRRLRAFVREYVDNDIRPYADQWEKQGFVPDKVRIRHCQKGFAIVSPPQEKYMAGLSLPASIPPEEWDGFHTLVLTDELNRIGYSGVVWALGAGNGIGCPPMMNFGTEAQRAHYLPRVAAGRLRFCLGITEPGAGSDVARIATTAQRAGDHYVVNGAKKWITNGVWADCVTAAVRTGGPGRTGISLLIVPLMTTTTDGGKRARYPGVSVRRMENSGVGASGSAFIEFDDVRVPVGNLIGQEGQGFQIIMSNFNPERIALAGAALRLSRLCAEDAFAYAVSRETFGRKLIENQAISAKISRFGQLIEPCFAFLEQLVYTIEVARRTARDINIGGQTALLKVMSTRCLEKVCREAQQIMGGAGYSRTGKGARIEQISRDVRVYVVGGGSEEILRDLAVRQEIIDMRKGRGGESKM